MSVVNYGPGNGKGNYNGNGAGRASRPESPALGDRLPPQNIEAEKSLLGSILLDNDVLHEIMPMVGVDDFYRDAHQVIYDAIRHLYDLGKGIDAVILAEELIRRDQFQKIGGDETLREIVDFVPHAANAKYYAGIVRERSISRQLIDTATEILRDGYSNQFTAQDLVESAERKIFSIAEEQIQGDTLELKDVVTKAMDRIAERAETGGHAITGLATGLIDLDDLTGGFQPGQLIVLAARPSMGKTALALNVCEHAAIKNKVPVLFVSLEMAHLEIAERLLCSRSQIDNYKLRTGKGLGTREMSQLGKAFNDLTTGGQIFIDDTASRNMLQIGASARRLRRRKELGLIVVDYIQLVDSEESRDSRQEQIAKISRRLKTLARELHLPVIALSQLNRAVENREDRRPRMADLRESGAIEQDADIVLLLHRPEYYDANDQPGIAELIVAKNRNGKTDTVKLTFLKNLMKFDNLATVAEPFDEGSGSPF
ncbi:MAG: replicative DNA helicase [Isosphaeraceae bacterium]